MKDSVKIAFSILITLVVILLALVINQHYVDQKNDIQKAYDKGYLKGFEEGKIFGVNEAMRVQREYTKEYLKR